MQNTVTSFQNQDFGTKNLMEQHGDFGLKIQNHESENELCSKEQK